MEGPRRTAVASAPREGVVTRWLQASSLLRRQRLPWRPCGTPRSGPPRQEHTLPAATELTTHERLHLEVTYPEPVALGRPFTADLNGNTRALRRSVVYVRRERQQENLHTLSRYEIYAPTRPALPTSAFVIKGRFFTRTDSSSLVTRCSCNDPDGPCPPLPRVRNAGQRGSADVAANDGTFTGQFQFAEEKNADGLWMFFVIAQDINTAHQPCPPSSRRKSSVTFLRTTYCMPKYASGYNISALLPTVYILGLLSLGKRSDAQKIILIFGISEAMIGMVDGGLFSTPALL